MEEEKRNSTEAERVELGGAEQSNQPGQSDQPEEGQPSVGRSTLVMTVATTFSRITGFVRAWAMGLALGTSAVASAYNTANNVPNMIFELVAGGILSSLFIPTFLDVRKRRGDEAAWRFAGNMMALCALALGAVALIGTFFPEPIMWTQYFLRGSSGSSAEVQQLANFFFRFFAIQVVFYGVGMIIQALLNAQRKFLWAALGPAFNNLIIIAFMLAAIVMPMNKGTYTFIALGTTLGVLIMFVVMMPSLRKTGFRLYLGIDLRDPDLRAMLKLSLPMLFYVACNLIAVSVRNAAAASVDVGGQAVVAYAYIWMNLPYGIIAVSLATALFTELSHAATSNNIKAFKVSLVSGLRTTTLLMLPASALLFSLSGPLISLYVGGRMSASDALPIMLVLQVWAVTLVFYAGTMYLLRAFYSLRDTLTPALANFACTILQVAGYLLLTGGVLSLPLLGLLGIPVADGVYFIVLFVVLLWLLRRKIGPYDIRQFIVVFAKMTLVSLIVGVLCWFASGALVGLLGSGRVASVLVVVCVGLLGLGLTALAARVLGVEEIADFGTKLKRRFIKAR